MGVSLNIGWQAEHYIKLVYQFKRWLNYNCGIKLFLFDQNIKGYEKYFIMWLKIVKHIDYDTYFKQPKTKLDEYKAKSKNSYISNVRVKVW
jgi:hypothetical protein